MEVELLEFCPFREKFANRQQRREAQFAQFCDVGLSESVLQKWGEAYR